MRRLRHATGHVIGFSLQASQHDVAVTGDRPAMELIRQGLDALDQATPEPRACDTPRTTAAAPRDPLDQPVCAEPSGAQPATHGRPQAWQ